MKISDTYSSNSKYYKASDLGGKEEILTIERVTQEELGREREVKAVVCFKSKEKGLVLNKTNAERLSYRFGDDTKDWAGNNVELYVEPVVFEGRKMDGLRVRPTSATASKVDFNDDVPWAPEWRG